MRRRQFLQSTAAAATALTIPDRIIADPYAPLGQELGVSNPTRIGGRVSVRGSGLRGVRVSDGVSVATTEDDGTYTLVTDGIQPFVHLSVPSGHRIPTSPTGTAKFYQPIPKEGPSEMQAHFQLEQLPKADDQHAFLVLADPQTQNAFEMARFHDETVPDVRHTLEGIGDTPAFGVACGDIMYDDLKLYPEYEAAARDMGIPFYQVIGNHDLVFETLSDEGAATTFESHFGPTYYSFNRGDVHYIVLDDVFWHGQGYIGYMQERQQRWLVADLLHVEPGSTVVVFLHIPALSTRGLRNGAQRTGLSESVTNREILYRVLEPYRAYVLSGHTHENDHHTDGGVHHHVHGTVCGAWWSGDICWDGTPNGYGVYDVRGSEVRWRYKATGQHSEAQMTLHQRGADPNAPDDFIANVWDADDRWRVVWYEDGERRGLMQQRAGHDPDSVRLHTGPDLPPRREWVEPTMTHHLFYAPGGSGTSKIHVEATNPWGDVFSATL